MKQQTTSSLWKSLEDHAQTAHLHTPQHLNVKQQPVKAFSCNIHLDYTHQHIGTETLELLFSLADSCHLREKILALMRGDNVNLSENKPALHTALRATGDTPIMVNHQNVMPEIMATRHKMRAIAEKIRAKYWFGFSGKAMTDIINIGIGGSDLGPRFALNALSEYATKDLNYHFISDADPTSFETTVANLNPETTLFIIASKSFTTQETIYNAKKAFAWVGGESHRDKHFIAVTANAKLAYQFGITIVLPIWDWIGGRYSFCSAINLITIIAIGYEQFDQILAGANVMDQHFLETDFSINLPILLALLGIWNNNFLHIHNLLILTYAKRLEKFVPYIQQLDMESNGKSINNKGKPVGFATGPMVWGGSGNQAQHSYYQLLCQGTHKITADFISLSTYNGQIINNMCDAKISVLTSGVSAQVNPNDFIPKNISLNHICINNYSPFTIGALITLYEHKIFAQSVIWDINPFDQPGVVSAKQGYISKNKYKAVITSE